MTRLINDKSPSPFHSGEREVQRRMGVRDKMERFGRKVIRDFMPEQHRAFYHQLPFVFVGHADQEGWPWASILFNKPGFMESKDERSLSINAKPVDGDPLNHSLMVDTKLGLLGIELTTRRRNRLAAHIHACKGQQIELTVDQAFGNCPQYIQTRELEVIKDDGLPDSEVHDITHFDREVQDLISSSDTFFVASYVANDSGEASEGVDVSHRGGRPGFIRIDDDQNLTIPDYLGNNHFNTFGNFIENSKAGLLFLDFERGHIVTLTGTVEILWDSPDTRYFEGAERLWTFKLDHGRKLKHVLPLRWKQPEFSPNSLLTGTWQEAQALKEAERLKEQWRPYKVEKIVQESSVITSFYLSAEGHQATKFIPGQFLTIKAEIQGKEQVRTYTLSSSPSDDFYRISVKREVSPDGAVPEGVFSNHLHSNVTVGDTLFAKAPTGQFKFDTASERPVLLLAGGVGITPMVSIARYALMEGFRTRKMRQVTFIGAARDHQQRAFYEELNEISEASQHQIQAFWTLSQVDSGLQPGKDFQHSGRISKELLQSILPLDDYDCYLCGPSGFMQACYDLLRSIGVSDARIHAEAFGPSTMKRTVDQATQCFEVKPAAEQAIVEFSDSQVEQAWSKDDGNLLEFAEAHGFTPEFGCRSGQCGACKVKLISGNVVYETEHPADIRDDEVLLCCAVPAAVDGEEVTKVSIAL